MTIEKTCKTCEFNFGGTCADVFYGEPVKDNESCQGWNYSFDYFRELIDGLPVEMKTEALMNPSANAHKIIRDFYEEGKKVLDKKGK